MKELGKKPQTDLLSFEKMQVTPYLSKHLNLEVGTDMLEFERLRKADGKPMMFERTYVPASLFSDLKKKDCKISHFMKFFQRIISKLYVRRMKSSMLV